MANSAAYHRGLIIRLLFSRRTLSLSPSIILSRFILHSSGQLLPRRCASCLLAARCQSPSEGERDRLEAKPPFISVSRHRSHPKCDSRPSKWEDLIIVEHILHLIIMSGFATVIIDHTFCPYTSISPISARVHYTHITLLLGNYVIYLKQILSLLR